MGSTEKFVEVCSKKWNLAKAQGSQGVIGVIQSGYDLRFSLRSWRLCESIVK